MTSLDLFSETLDKLPELQQLLDHSFDDIRLLLQALLTVSYVNDFQDKSIFKKLEIDHQDALRTLGDGVLDVILMEEAMHDGKRKKGELTIYKNRFGNNYNLYQIALANDLQDYVIWGKEQIEHSQWLNSDKLLSNTLEAIIGAAYLDDGMEASRKIVMKLGILEK